MDSSSRSALIYGGLHTNDYQLLEKMNRQKKLIIAEYNTIALPTSAEVRMKMENLFELKFSGWIGKSFKSLNHIVNPEIPSWIVTKYAEFTGEEYEFPDVAGIILIHESGEMLILQDGVHLDLKVPSINTQISHRNSLDLPDFMNYPFWFDIIHSTEEENIVATYKIHTNTLGDSILASFDLSNKFPAIVGNGEDGTRYYFCGDFANNPVQDALAYFKGISMVSSLFYNNLDVSDRKRFFWTYYHPLMTNIISNYTDNRAVLAENLNDTNALNLEVSDMDAMNDSTLSDSLDSIDFANNSDTHSDSEEGSEAQLSETDESLNEGFELSYPDETNKQWRIVIASLKSRTGTKRYLDQLNNPEINAVYIDYLETHRITFGPFSNLGEGQQKFQEVLRQYPEAWMIKF
jgi:hypothetical protein